MNSMQKYGPFALLLVLGVALLFTLAEAAKASLGPVGPRTAAISSNDLEIVAVVPLEQDYFRAPPVDRAAGPALPCRLQMRIFDKTRLAQWCR